MTTNNFTTACLTSGIKRETLLLLCLLSTAQRRRNIIANKNTNMTWRKRKVNNIITVGWNTWNHECIIRRLFQHRTSHEEVLFFLRFRQRFKPYLQKGESYRTNRWLLIGKYILAIILWGNITMLFYLCHTEKRFPISPKRNKNNLVNKKGTSKTDEDNFVPFVVSLCAHS